MLTNKTDKYEVHITSEVLITIQLFQRHMPHILCY